MLYFSRSTLGFYDSEINSTIPNDAVEITALQRRNLLAEQTTGKQIVADSNGFPIAQIPVVNNTPVVPFSVTPFQAKAAMYNAGLLPSVLAIIDNPATPELTKLAWNNVTEFTRDSPLLNGLASRLGLTRLQVDDLFLDASLIKI